MQKAIINAIVGAVGSAIVGIVSLMIETLFPKRKEKANVVSDPNTTTRPYARPDRLRPFGGNEDDNMGKDGDPGQDS